MGRERDRERVRARESERERDHPHITTRPEINKHAPSYSWTGLTREVASIFTTATSYAY